LMVVPGAEGTAPHPHMAACWVDVRTARPDPAKVAAAAEQAAVPAALDVEGPA
jgi:hypothetical protein